MSDHLSLEQAIAVCCNVLLEPISENGVVQTAYNRVLAEELRASIDYPPFSRSMMDGYAVHLDEKATSDNPSQRYRVMAEIAAGDRGLFSLEAGQAARVMTGAMLPAGADIVVKQEDVLLYEGGIHFSHLPGKRRYIQTVGQIISRDDVLGEKGDCIAPFQVERMVSGGIESLKVYAIPTVGIVNTGSELIASGTRLEPGQIYNSNRPMLTALISREQCVPYIHKIKTPDQRKEIIAELSHQLEKADLMIVTGGTARGDFDLMEEVLTAMDAQLVFHHLQMKPGQGTLAALKDNKLILCLPGNPGAISLLFETLLVPILRRLRGLREVQNRWFEVRLWESIQRRMDERSLRWGEILGHQGDIYVKEAAQLSAYSPASKQVILDLKPQQGDKLDIVRAMIMS